MLGLRGRAIQGTGEFVVNLFVAIAIGIGAVDAPFRVAEVGSVSESYGWGEHMADGTNGTMGKVDHAVNFSGKVAADAEVHKVAESVDGVGLQVSSFFIVDPLLLDVLEIHVVVERERVGP